MYQALYFDNLMSFLKQKFEQVTGHRNQLNSTKPLADALMSGLAVFSLKTAPYCSLRSATKSEAAV
jgi:hypothetical protein